MNIARRLPHIAASDDKGTVNASTNQLSTLVLRLLTLLALAGFVVSAYFSLVYAGADTLQGNVQRIFYVHVAAFSGAFCALAATVVGGIAYLRTRNPGWDRLALAGVEVGVFLSLITLFTGMVWARPIWNTWWTWDWRLTSVAIMVLTYAAYLMLRSGIDNPDKRRSLAAVYGILAFGTVIFTFVVTRIRPDTIHPVVIGSSAQNAQGGFSMTDSMRTALGVSSIVWCCFITPALLWWRIRLERLHERAEQLRVELS
jgi:heme exporter protein C